MRSKPTKRPPADPSDGSAVARDPYSIITDRIVSLLESGTVPWRKPWANAGTGADGAPLNVRGTRYRGVNVFLLACQGYGSPYWLTFKQARELDGAVRKGEKATPVVFWKVLGPKADAATPDAPADSDAPAPADRRGLILRYYSVFNVEQCDLPDAALAKLGTPAAPAFDPIPECERIVAEMPNRPPIGHGGTSAHYSPSMDAVQMPPRVAFDAPASYYCTLFHELGHATGHASRLNRKTVGDAPARFGSAAYGREELVAEMTAAFLCGRAGISPAVIDNEAAYIASWIGTIKADPKAVVMAAAQAQKAADYILGDAAHPASSCSCARPPRAHHGAASSSHHDLGRPPMSYWNRDLCNPKLDSPEPFRCWHDNCFDVAIGRPARWQQQEPRVFESASAFVDSIFGGPEHRAELEALPADHPLAHYREAIARWRENAVEPVTPTGYAWGPWRGGAPCAHCGKAA